MEIVAGSVKPEAAKEMGFLYHQGPGEGYNEWPAAPCLP